MRITRSKMSWRILAQGQEQNLFLDTLALLHGYRVCELCRALGCSARYLHVVFVRDIGLPPKDWMRRERMVVARHLLQQGLEPAAVADHLGFTKPNNFRREFLNFYQVTPLDYQKKWRSTGTHHPS